MTEVYCRQKQSSLDLGHQIEVIGFISKRKRLDQLKVWLAVDDVLDNGLVVTRAGILHKEDLDFLNPYKDKAQEGNYAG